MLRPIARLLPRRLTARLMAVTIAATALWVAPLHVLADGLSPENAQRMSPAAVSAPRMSIDLVAAQDDAGQPLGTLVMPSLLGSTTPVSPDRPLLVVFNGGPGAGSAWLQLGLLGPRHVVLPDPGSRLRPRLEVNADTLRQRADILFVDPLGTGFSRARDGADRAQFHEWQADGAYLARAIRVWMARHGRERAPVVLLGESYGSERAIAVAEALEQSERPVRLAGLVLISQTVLSEQGVRAEDRTLATALALPTMAATACHYGLTTSEDRQPLACAAHAQTLAESELPAARHDPRRRDATLLQLAGLTGLRPDAFDPADLSLSRDRYRQIALAAHSRVLGRYDSRTSAPVPVVAAHGWQDPSLDPLLPGMTAMARRAALETLGLRGSPLDRSPYVLFDPAIMLDWRYGPQAPQPGSSAMAARLDQLLTRSGARVLIAGGLFDGVGGYGADAYLGTALRRQSADRVEVHSYPGGHMFYLEQPNRAAFLQHLQAFIARCTPASNASRPA